MVKHSIYMSSIDFLSSFLRLASVDLETCILTIDRLNA